MFHPSNTAPPLHLTPDWNTNWNMRSNPDWNIGKEPPVLDQHPHIQAAGKAFFMALERPILPTDLAPLPYDEALDVLLSLVEAGILTLNPDLTFTHHSKETSNVAND